MVSNVAIAPAFIDRGATNGITDGARVINHGLRRQYEWTLAFVLVFLQLTTAKLSATDGPPAVNEFLLSTPQIQDPLRPLAHAAIAAKRITVHAAVVGVADPLETQLGRAFDIQVSSLVRAFHARGYVLDAFALTWDPALASELQQGLRLPDRGTQGFQDRQRSQPSVLLFRRDTWRDAVEEPSARYVVLFLVGESPTFGLHPEAFRTAAKCAAALNGTTSEKVGAHSIASLQEPCTEIFDRDVRKDGQWTLKIVGPSFSGSMQSLAISLGEVFEQVRNACRRPDDKRNRRCATRVLNISVTSPSATVESNVHVADWAKRLSGDAVEIEYKTLAASLEDQLVSLCKLAALNRWDPKTDAPPKIVILAEESSFGRGVTELLRTSDRLKTSNRCSERIRLRMFPQNISAIRGEKTRRKEQANASVGKLIPSRERLLPLDLTDVGESIDRPPALHRQLSSRSDELMLYQAFDAMRVWIEPVAVAIVATDVRDRLFLLNEVRKNLPKALPVLMEMDFLTAHPDYRSISRGSVVIPSGLTLIQLDSESGDLEGIDRKPSRQFGTGDSASYAPREFHSFAADYAANMFRAVLSLIDQYEDRDTDLTIDRTLATRPLVTTSAGFQELSQADLEDGEKDASNVAQGSDASVPQPKRTRSTFIAADARIALELPYYVALWVVGFVILVSGSWIAIFGRAHLIMVSVARNFNPLNGVREADKGVARGSAPATQAMETEAPIRSLAVPSRRSSRLLGSLLGAVGVCLVVLAISQLLVMATASPRDMNWRLAHGRDVWALGGVSLVYAAFAIVGFWRLWLWQRRYDHFRSEDGVADPQFEGHDPSIREEHNSLALPAAAVVFVFLIVQGYSRGLPSSVDSPLPSLMMGLILLPVGAWFLGQFWTQARHWSQLAMALGGTMPLVSQRMAMVRTSDDAGWPSPTALGELPQSPYGLHFRRRDLQALGLQSGDVRWEEDTRALRAGNWPFPDGRSQQFLKWQARLVAEMRYAAVAVRFAALCGILAPTAVLIGLDVYPPYDQRLQTTVSVAMIILGFLLVMYQALKFERHPLLGRMFTQHGDKLSLGGAFGALWPKLIAASVILVPVLFPDVQAWLHTLVRSINSLQ